MAFTFSVIFSPHSKDGDNEFMNIIANEIGFEVRQNYILM